MNQCSNLPFTVGAWAIVALLIVIIVLAIWSERRRTRGVTGRFDITRRVVIDGLTPEEQHALEKVLANEGFDALQRKVAALKQARLKR